MGSGRRAAVAENSCARCATEMEWTLTPWLKISATHAVERLEFLERSGEMDKIVEFGVDVATAPICTSRCENTRLEVLVGEGREVVFEAAWSF